MNPIDVSLPDTNTILRYLLDDEPSLSAKSRVYWENVRDGKTRAILTEGVLMECVYVLQRFYKVPREAVVTQLTGLLAYKGLDRDNLELYQASLVVYARTTLDFVDCILYAREKSGQGTVFSFDGKLNKLLSQNGNGV